MKKAKKLAIFDFDKTLTTRDSTVVMAIYFAKRTKNYFYFLNFIIWGILYKFKCVSNKKTKNEFLIILKTLTREEIYNLVSDVYRFRIKNILRENIVEEFKKYKNSGYKTVLLSAQFDFIIKEIADNLGFDYYIATRTDLDNLKVNGDIIEGQKKAEAIKFLFSDMDLKHSVAFVDNKKKDIFLEEVIGELIWV